jgi:hypothetical protein
MQPFTVFGVYEEDDMMTFREVIEAQNAAQAAVIAGRRGVSAVAVLPGDHTTAAFVPPYAGQFSAYNGMDGGDEITDAERGDLT